MSTDPAPTEIADVFAQELVLMSLRVLCAEFVTDPQLAQFTLDNNGLNFGVKPGPDTPALRVHVTVSAVVYPIATPQSAATPTEEDAA